MSHIDCQLGCSNSACHTEVENLYDIIVNSVTESSFQFRKKRIKKDKFKVIPGWNRRIKDLHTLARKHYLELVRLGKPRDHLSFDYMKIHRAQFKQELKACKVDANRESLLSIEEKFKDRNKKQFWQEVNKRRGGTMNINSIDGYSTPVEILKVFDSKFLPESVLTRDTDISCKSIVNEGWRENTLFHMCVSSYTVKKLISKLNIGCGHDGIHSNFLKHANDNFIENFTYFINLCFKHCILPVDILNGEISPIIKDKKGSKFDSSNYRPVMQSSCLLKIIELHILSVLEEKVHLDFRQFGFVNGASTTDACFLLNETVNMYISDKYPIYANFIDLSKAFDLVDHTILLKELVSRRIPGDIISILYFYFRYQKARLKVNAHYGEYKRVNQGVRQGGIISPFLFKLYIDGVMRHLSSLDIGCRFSMSRVNVIAYADDIVLLANCRSALEKIYSEFKKSLDFLKLKINVNKSKVLLFYKGQPRNEYNNVTLDNDEFEIVREFKYLGNIITYNLGDDMDVKLKLNNFYSSFHSVFRNFNGINHESFLHLFNSICAPQYGLPLWNSFNIYLKHNFKAFEIAYSGALKMIVGCPKFSSSHITAEMIFLFLRNVERLRTHLHPDQESNHLICK